MKKFLLALMACLSISIAAEAQDFYPSCSNNDGVSYVQGKTESRNGTWKIHLNGYGNYTNATVLVIVYSQNIGQPETERYRTTVEIKDGKGSQTLTSVNNVSRVEIQVANYCR